MSASRGCLLSPPRGLRGRDHRGGRYGGLLTNSWRPVDGCRRGGSAPPSARGQTPLCSRLSAPAPGAIAPLPRTVSEGRYGPPPGARAGVATPGNALGNAPGRPAVALGGMSSRPPTLVDWGELTPRLRDGATVRIVQGLVDAEQAPVGVPVCPHCGQMVLLAHRDRQGVLRGFAEPVP